MVSKLSITYPHNRDSPLSLSLWVLGLVISITGLNGSAIPENPDESKQDKASGTKCESDIVMAEHCHDEALSWRSIVMTKHCHGGAL